MHGHMERGAYGLPKVSPRPTMPYPSRDVNKIKTVEHLKHIAPLTAVTVYTIWLEI
jgi:hypothetical protein